MKGKVKRKGRTGWSLIRLILDEIPDEGARLTCNLNYISVLKLPPSFK